MQLTARRTGGCCGGASKPPTIDSHRRGAAADRQELRYTLAALRALVEAAEACAYCGAGLTVLTFATDHARHVPGSPTTPWRMSSSLASRATKRKGCCPHRSSRNCSPWSQTGTRRLGRTCWPGCGRAGGGTRRGEWAVRASGEFAKSSKCELEKANWPQPLHTVGTHSLASPRGSRQ